MEQNEQNEELDFNNVLDEFRTAVFNGQVRLALEHLVTIVDVFVEVLSSEEDAAKEEIKPETKEADKKEQASTVEEKPVAKKTTTTKEVVAEKTEE